MTEPGSGDGPARSGPASAPQLDSEPESQLHSLRSEARQPRRRGQVGPRLRAAMIATAATLGWVLVVALVVGVFAYVKFNGNITAVDVSPLLGERPKNVAPANKLTNLKPINILVLGSDTRDLGTSEFGKDPGERADTTLILHLSGDRQSAVVTSIPRDSMTRAPRNCEDPASKVADGPIRMWNANYSLGGPACVIRAVEGNTGIPIDHFMVVDFLSFRSMVDALGTVEVCLPEAVRDAKSKLNLPAGRSQVSGEQALAFVRVRQNIGKDASDLGRIKRQQAFLSAMVQEATSSNLLLRPDKLFRFLDAATKSLTTDPGLGNLNALREVAQSMVGLKSSQVRFVTVPVEAYPRDANRVQWSSDAKALWDSIRYDTPLPGAKGVPGAKPIPKPTPQVLTVRPDRITVQVSNAAGVPGLARQAAEDLAIQGFKVKESVTANNPQDGVTVAYSGLNALNREKARTVAAAFPGAVLVEDATAGEVINVTLGSGSPNVVEVPNRMGSTPLPTHTLTATVAPTPLSNVTIQARTADTDVCSK